MLKVPYEYYGQYIVEVSTMRWKCLFPIILIYHLLSKYIIYLSSAILFSSLYIAFKVLWGFWKNPLQLCKSASNLVQLYVAKTKTKPKKKQPTNYSQGKINKVLCYWRLPFILQNKKAENRRSFNLVSCFDKWLPCGVSFTNNLSFTFNLAI